MAYEKFVLIQSRMWLPAECCLTMLSATCSREVVIGLLPTALPLQTFLLNFSQLILPVSTSSALSFLNSYKYRYV